MLYATAALALVSLAAIPVARGANFNVTVGGPGILAFAPDQVNAAPGDTITFIFQQKNHTVTQSTLQDPCTALASGFDSGFNPVGDDVVDPSQFPTAVLTVPDANPIWAYCKQGNHCQQGMVFAVNPGTEFDAFKAAATGGASSAAPTATAPATTTAAPPASTTAAGAAATHTVVVGGPGVLAFNPSNVPANVGDTIVFQFKQKNHTVTQSTFDAPCRAIAATSSTGQIGFDSGFVPVADAATDFPTFSVQVNSTSPAWAYCRQATHCGQGMVFAVNAPTTGSQSFDAFVNLAKSLNGTSGNNGGYGGGNGGDSNSAVGAFVSGRLGVAVSVAALFLGVLL